MIRIENLRKQIDMLDEQIMTGERTAKAGPDAHITWTAAADV